jgi:hypothetical protein
MRTDWSHLNEFRVRGEPFETKPNDRFGCFKIRSKGARLQVIASCGAPDYPWEHVSVRGQGCCPTWEQMSNVKNLFWGSDECVVQFHPAEKDYVNIHPHVLHLWACPNIKFPMPPKEMV